MYIIYVFKSILITIKYNQMKINLYLYFYFHLTKIFDLCKKIEHGLQIFMKIQIYILNCN